MHVETTFAGRIEQMSVDAASTMADEGRTRSSGGKLSTLFGDVFSNWRLVLLALTGLVLSLASGWTTWDGMSNFTCPNVDAKNAEPCFAPRILSGMITFGIQGVMLIIAWIIGETFAKNRSEQRLHRSGWFGGGLLLAAMFIVLAALAAVLSDQADNLAGVAQNLGSFGFPSIPTSLGWWLAFAAVLALVLARKELAARYISGFKTILSHLPLWIMFLACMATSVFFSFDSLFSTIFPQGERVRAAKLRVENQVAGVMSDVQAQLEIRRLGATRQLFASSQWQGFDNNLDQLVAAAESAPDAVLQQKLDRVKQSSSARNELRALISVSKAGKGTLESELGRTKLEIKDLEERLAPGQAQVALLEEQLDAKKAEMVTANTAAEGERQGVRGTGNAGAGPEFRRLRKVVQNLQLDADEIETRLKSAQARVSRLSDEANGKRQRVTEIGKELIALDEKIKEASDRQAVLDQNGQNTIAADLDAAGGIKALDVARNKFRRAPVESGLDQLEQLCTSLLANLRGVESLKQRTANVNCEPGDASVLANGIFKLQTAEAAFRANCTSGAKLPRNSANKLLKFGSVCIQDSGLRGADTENFRTQLNRIALNRDDKAHRFVVSWNAFNDGNALAYLALAIAIAIDGLVFMSGLFGASVIRSPLSAISEEELERVIDNALGENKYKTLMDTMEAIEVNSDAGRSSFCHQIPGHVTEADKSKGIRRVVAAGRDLDVVKWDGDEVVGRHLIHADFNKALQEASNRHHESFITDSNDDAEDARLKAIKTVLKENLEKALKRDVFENANAVLDEIHPSSERVGYMGYVEKPAQSFWTATRKVLGRTQHDQKVQENAKGNYGYLRRAISVGTREGMVKTDDDGEVFYIRPLFFDALNEIRAEATAKPAQSSDSNLEQKSPVSPTAQAAAISPMPVAIDRATVGHEEQVHKSTIEKLVRAKFIELLNVDSVEAGHAQEDAAGASNILQQLRQLPGVVAQELANHVSTEAEKAIAQSKQVVLGYRGVDLDVAHKEHEAMALAFSGQFASTHWAENSRKILEDLQGEHAHFTDERTLPNQRIEDDSEMRELAARLRQLASHDRFNNDLVELVRDADKANSLVLELRQRREYGDQVTPLYKH